MEAWVKSALHELIDDHAAALVAGLTIQGLCWPEAQLTRERVTAPSGRGAYLSIVYGGHRVAADFALRKGHPKAFTWRLDGQEGFDPKALALGELTVRQPILLPPEDLWQAPVPLKWGVGSVGGRYTLTCALPDGDWSGWTLDPTLIIQPGAAAGQDTYISASGSGYGSVDRMWCQQSGMGLRRALIKFDLSGVPDDVLITGAYFGTRTLQGNYTYSVAMCAYRLKRPWTEMEASWTDYTTGQAWATPGGFGADDCEQTPISTTFVPHLTGVAATWYMPKDKAGMDLGYGWLLKYQNESGSYQVALASSDYATASYRPKLTIYWIMPGGGSVFAPGVFHSGVFGDVVVR